MTGWDGVDPRPAGLLDGCDTRLRTAPFAAHHQPIMGNCLVIQDRKEIKIMRVGGSKQALKMPSPSSSKVHDALAESPPGHGISGVLPVKAATAAVANPGAVRVKLVISKQELKRMLDKESMSLEDVVSLMRREADDRDRVAEGGDRRWRAYKKAMISSSRPG
ncbi:hypothetical protein ACP70R_047911 [Stipagrostis hirtigluma subsp. patula]